MDKIKYLSINSYLKKEYGMKIYKVSLDGGFSCPNRDGKIGLGGCIFCSSGGSGDFASNRELSISKQIEEGKKKICAKLPKNEEVGYIAYFQAFTNTYGPVDELKRKYLEAIKSDDIKILSIATRPDCLSGEVLDLLAEINAIKPVWVELGLQTIHERSAKYIRRGYELSVYDKAVSDLKKIGIKVITHVILGLPNESREDMLETVRYVAKTETFGIKLQLLHVLKDTDLLADYENGLFNTLEMDEYIDIVSKALKIIPLDMTVHRLTGDGDKRTLVAPLWSANKKQVLNSLSKHVESV
ncbi:MAG: TIGR01212 family radical SAM protein [Lachnospiraceae bacterium]|nr:TIGR01212 family radical SAM protein [Lachnospiraceae bacterium]